jgi:uncharacterized protein YndB with AHSA1/START domain
METSQKTSVTVSATVNAPLEKVWNYFTQPEHITKWSQASGDWHAPYAENDLRSGGKFKTRMEAKDGSVGFDFEGVYTNVQPQNLIEYKLGDERKVRIAFSGNDGETKVEETFDAETINPVEMQRSGWQAILDNFKKYTESN